MKLKVVSMLPICILGCQHQFFAREGTNTCTFVLGLCMQPAVADYFCLITKIGSSAIAYRVNRGGHPNGWKNTTAH